MKFDLPIKVYLDGDMWCALLGKDLQEGLAGFGKTPKRALKVLCETLTENFLNLPTSLISEIDFSKGEKVKPVLYLSGSEKGTSGIMRQTDKALRNAGMKDKADKFILEARKSISYDKLLHLCEEYVTIK